MYPIQIRAEHQYGVEVDFATAIKIAMGADERTSKVVVTAIYAERTETRPATRNREAMYAEAGEPVFGFDAEVSGWCQRYGTDSEATVNMAAIGSHSPEDAMVRAQCYLLAAQIAAAANAAANATK